MIPKSYLCLGLNSNEFISVLRMTENTFPQGNQKCKTTSCRTSVLSLYYSLLKHYRAQCPTPQKKQKCFSKEPTKKIWHIGSVSTNSFITRCPEIRATALGHDLVGRWEALGQEIPKRKPRKPVVRQVERAEQPVFVVRDFEQQAIGQAVFWWF